MARKKICIATGTRAEWGLLSPIARELQRREDIQLQIVATNMHLDSRYGHTIDEITGQGFSVDARVDMSLPERDSDSDRSKVKAMARCADGMAEALSRLAPDLLVILGDRYEMLSTATAAMMLGIPIAHLHGGEVTLGAVDNSIRHAITKMASLHLTSTETYRRRVIQMGERPERVINTGAIGVHNAMNVPPMSRQELEESIGMKLDRDTILLTYHPVTLDPERPAVRFQAILDAIDRLQALKVLITYPNNDAGGQEIISMIEDYRARNPERVTAIPSLGMRRYLSVLRHIGAVAGNSSSGIIEVPSSGIPTVDIGIRQKGRVAAGSVIHCGDSADEIHEAIVTALSDDTRRIAAEAVNPYFRPDTLQLIVRALTETDIPRFEEKPFFDLND